MRSGVPPAWNTPIWVPERTLKALRAEHKARENPAIAPGAPGPSGLDPSKIPAPTRPRPDITRPPPDVTAPVNHALRAPTTSFWAQQAMRFGLRAPETTGATRAALCAAEMGRNSPTFGAPLREAALKDMPPKIREVCDDLGSLWMRLPTLDRVLNDSASTFVALLDVALGLGILPEVRSLRELVNITYSKRNDRQDALRRMDAHLAQARRHADEPVHDLHTDPTGLRGPSHDGRLPHTIDKVLLIRRLGRMTKADLANRHEVVGNNRAKVYSGGGEAYPAILEAVRRATDSVHVSYFIFKDGECGNEFARLLMDKARQGVKVRINLDQAGQVLAGAKNLTNLSKRLRGAGVEVTCNRLVDMDRQIRPLNSPDHRKQVIIDGKRAFTGGLNMGDEYVHQWHDVVVGLEGDVVHQLQADWMLNWMALHGELDPGVTDDTFRARYFPAQPAVGQTRFKLAQAIPGHNPEIRRGSLQMIEEAHDEILIQNPYITSVVAQEALLRAAHRGVKVKLVIPGENNHVYCDLAARTVFGRMMEAGIEIYEYPGMSHGKLMVVDGEVSSIGTSNLDDLSLRTIYEMNVFSDDKGFAASLVKQVFEPDIAKSRRLQPTDLKPSQLAAGHLWKVLTPLL